MYILLYKSTHLAETKIIGAWALAKHAVMHAIQYFFENNLLDVAKCDRHKLQSVFENVEQYTRTPESIKKIFVNNLTYLTEHYESFAHICNMFGKNIVDWDTGETLWELVVVKTLQD